VRGPKGGNSSFLLNKLNLVLVKPLLIPVSCIGVKVSDYRSGDHGLDDYYLTGEFDSS